MKQWREANKERVNALQRARYEARREEKLEYHRNWRSENKDSVNSSQKRWYEGHGAEYREENKERIRANANAYYHRNKEKYRDYVEANKEKTTVYQNEYVQLNKERLNEYDRKRWHKTSPRYEGVTGIPDGGPPNTCEICGNADSRICLDHCHQTNTFRGWICNNCNLAIGLVKDNTQTLERIIEYLRNHRQKPNERAVAA
jgi:hypothetical protein